MLDQNDIDNSKLSDCLTGRNIGERSFNYFSLIVPGEFENNIPDSTQNGDAGQF